MDNGFDDEKDPPLMYREQEKNKRLPSTSDDQSTQVAKVKPINESICDVTQDLDISSDEDEKVGIVA